MTDKQRLFESIAKALKASGHLIITDQFLRAAVPTVNWQDSLRAVDEGVIDVAPMQAYADALQALGLRVWVCEDVTDSFRQLVARDMRRFLHAPSPPDVGPEILHAMRQEVALWETRFSLFDAGILGVCRIYATKEGKNPREQTLVWTDDKAKPKKSS